jgi:hypothetical protein
VGNKVLNIGAASLEKRVRGRDRSSRRTECSSQMAARASRLSDPLLGFFVRQEVAEGLRSCIASVKFFDPNHALEMATQDSTQ